MGMVHFVLVLHNHQPVGNFDNVFGRACTRAYEPFLKSLERYPDITVVLHYSGSLLEWIRAHRPGLFEKIKTLVSRGQIELLGSGFYEPILGMIPEDDRVGQIVGYRDWLNNHLDAGVRGLWLAERMWEQPLVKSLKKAGVEYTVVDDSHFKHAGLSESELYGYFLTRYERETLAVFPGSEELRHAIPFKSPDKTIEYLRRAAETCEDAVVVYADDGEKFGLWPNTFHRVYRNSWLENFFKALEKNRDWIRSTTLGGVKDNIKPRGEVRLPSVSYRELMKWALPADGSLARKRALKSARRLPQDDENARRFIKGGSWRNFLVKYPEVHQMYARMLEVSKRLSSSNNRTKRGADARRELYRGQCNDAYWHGTFGGLYIPHLRASVFRHLLAAETMADSRRGVRVETEDYDLDGTDEIKLTGPKLNAYFKPSRGGHLYELDYRPKCVNLTNTLARREEIYHTKVLRKEGAKGKKGAKSIHKRRPRTEKGLGKRLIYDGYRKESLIDHFFPHGTGLDDFVKGRAVELGDFVTLPYHTRTKRSGRKITLLMGRSGVLKHDGREVPLELKKTIETGPSRASLLIRYCLENISDDEMEFLFGVEFNLSMSAGNAPGRYYLVDNDRRAGHLAVKGCFSSQTRVRVVDEGLGLMVSLGLSRRADVWVCPVETVSRGRSGLEKVYQCSTVLPKWDLRLKPGSRWEVEIKQQISDA
ncbi:MAG: alpha-amylase/4-alpha-glucanotransferase domain-containing protein [Candidatus Brocadiales bacterium]